MRRFLGRLPRLTGRNIYILVLLVMMMLYDFNGPLFRVPMILFIIPWGCGVAYVAIQSYRGRVGLRNWLIITASAFLLIAAINSGDLGQMTLYALGAEIVCFLGVGIVPEHTAPETLKRELLSLAWAMILFMLPVMLLSVFSVFWGRAFHLGSGIMGLEYDGDIQSRIYIVAHPNIGGRRAEMCVLFAIYALYYAKRNWQRVLLWFTMVISVLAVVHSQSRACSFTLALILGAVAFHWVYLRIKNQKWGLLAGAASAAVAMGVTLAALNALFWLDVQIALRVMPAVAEAEEIGVSRVVTEGMFNLDNGRKVIWDTVKKYLQAHPNYLLIGTGAGDVIKKIAEEFRRISSFAHLHNSLLEVLVRGGIPMLLSTVGLLCSLIRPCIQMLLAPETDSDRGAYILPIIVGSMLVMTMTESMLFIRPTVINLIFFYAVGRIVYASRRQSFGQHQPS